MAHNKHVTSHALITFLVTLMTLGWSGSNPHVMTTRAFSNSRLGTSGNADANEGGSFGLFEENAGQFAADARFLLRMPESDLWVASDGAIWLALHTVDVALGAPEAVDPTRMVHLRLSFEGASANARIEGIGSASLNASYFKGAVADSWIVNAPLWQGVRIVDLLPGLEIDLWADDSSWRWVITPAAEEDGAQPGTQLPYQEPLRLVIEGAQTAQMIDGQIQIVTALGQVLAP